MQVLLLCTVSGVPSDKPTIEKEVLMRQVTWAEMIKHPLFDRFIKRAIGFPYDYNKKCSPITKDGRYVSVAAIYNVSRWANWKSSSLGKDEREVSVLLEKLFPYELMKMNHGRMSTDPAWFPDGELLPLVMDEDKLEVY